jgi:hypothetical protein
MCNFNHVLKPRFVILDTATFSHVIKNSHNVDVRDLLLLLRRGDWIPFITSHLLEEFAFHGSDDEFKRRFDFLRSLSHVGYLALPENRDIGGGFVGLQSYEIEFLVSHPNAAHEEIIEAVRPKVCSGFSSGTQFVNDNLPWWEFFRRSLASRSRRRAEKIAHLTHFPTFDMKQRLPQKGESIKTYSREEAILRSKRMANWLCGQIREHGDNRKTINPRLVATRFMQEVIEGCPDADYGAEEYSHDAFLERVGVKRDRLPLNPTEGDFLYEEVFVRQLSVYARCLLRNKDELLRCVRKEQLPSWVVWHELDRKIRQLPNAEIGNGNDKYIAAFGLYVDVLNADKRIAEMLHQASRKNSLLLQVFKRVPKKRGFSGLLDALKN